MSWIREIAESEASGLLAKLYDKLAPRGGRVAHILRCHSLNPAVLRDHLALYRTIMFARSGLSRREREMVATVVSAINGCHY
ncbi:MAG: peroxidase [Gemmatimonadetes bacterium]|nr:peroxidase [Gemmatimonadota bacterium]